MGENLRFTAWLVAIDCLAVLAFSYGGIRFHYVGGSPVLQVLRIGWPFALGLLGAGLILGAYRFGTVSRFALRGVGSWALGMGLGFALRGFQMGVLPSLIFVKISLVFTGLFLLVGRTCCWWLHKRKTI